LKYTPLNFKQIKTTNKMVNINIIVKIDSGVKNYYLEAPEYYVGTKSFGTDLETLLEQLSIILA
jgi:hypothetical protein